MAEALHWTEKSISEFVNRISFDFITQLAKKMESLPLKQGEFARKLGLTSGRISQIFNNPGNLTLNKIVKYARALGMKVAVVAYDDDDHDNKHGPISSEIFNKCWEMAGKPKDFWSLETKQSVFLTNVAPSPGAYDFYWIGENRTVIGLTKVPVTTNPQIYSPSDAPEKYFTTLSQSRCGLTYNTMLLPETAQLGKTEQQNG
jgi:plasmid maintenance system antidote protein VapI